MSDRGFKNKKKKTLQGVTKRNKMSSFTIYCCKILCAAREMQANLAAEADNL